MTLVLALRCRDGIVLASDGQATTDAAGQPTRQPVRKLFDVGARVAWGTAGCIGLQQTLADELAARGDELAAEDPARLRRRLAEIVIPIQQRALQDFVPHPGCLPPDLACIFCWFSHGEGRILSIPRTGSDHQLHHRHSAVGTGDIFADFAMASVAHLDTMCLSLEQAKMVAYKAVADAIDVAAVYLGPPIQMYVVDGRGARRVPEAELESGLADSVETWKARQRESLGPLAGADVPVHIVGAPTPITSPTPVASAAVTRLTAVSRRVNAVRSRTMSEQTMSNVVRSIGKGSEPARGEDSFSPEHLRELFHRKTMAGERHRAALARLLGMDATEAAALAHLAQHGQLTPGELGSLIGLTSGGTTALIHRLVESGHVVRHPHPRDRRSSLITASDQVLERAQEFYAPLVQEMNALAARLDDDDRAIIGRYLTEVAELSEEQAERLSELARTERRAVVAPPSPGLWA
jgi:DNA-binding MarR family transcriptional regulator/20S proteasome alpha/beta subunit